MTLGNPSFKYCFDWFSDISYNTFDYIISILSPSQPPPLSSPTSLHIPLKQMKKTHPTKTVAHLPHTGKWLIYLVSVYWKLSAAISCEYLFESRWNLMFTFSHPPCWNLLNWVCTWHVEYHSLCEFLYVSALLYLENAMSLMSSTTSGFYNLLMPSPHIFLSL